MSIFDEVLSFIAAPRHDLFESLALRVFRHQFERVAPYREYCLSRGVETADRLDRVPYASTLAFKYARMESGTAADFPGARLFLTSGTTIGKDERGRHLVLRPDIYRASAITYLRRMLFPDGRRTAMLALHPIAERMPESSLSQMISWCIDEFGGGPVLCAACREGVDTQAAIGFLQRQTAAGKPVSILATTAALATLIGTLNAAAITIELPRWSRLMDTGGPKGQKIPLTSEQVIAEARRTLGLDPAMVINEYGMTEMCSQLYDATSFNSADRLTPAVRVKLAPPWLRPLALNPRTLAPAGDGEIGMLAFFDLANVGSVSALMTEDWGIVRDGAVAILGRAAAAEPRGCALALEEFASSEGLAAPAHES